MARYTTGARRPARAGGRHDGRPLSRPGRARGWLLLDDDRAMLGEADDGEQEPHEDHEDPKVARERTTTGFAGGPARLRVRRNRPNLATTKPSPANEIAVRTQASRVRWLARRSRILALSSGFTGHSVPSERAGDRVSRAYRLASIRRRASELPGALAGAGAGPWPAPWPGPGPGPGPEPGPGHGMRSSSWWPGRTGSPFRAPEDKPQRNPRDGQEHRRGDRQGQPDHEGHFCLRWSRVPRRLLDAPACWYHKLLIVTIPLRYALEAGGTGFWPHGRRSGPGTLGGPNRARPGSGTVAVSAVEVPRR